MEKLIIKNFLIFEEVDLTVKKFNILIGPQASGKSLLAKLVYYFRNTSIQMRRNIEDGNDFDSFVEKMEKEFLEFFPLEYWSGEYFSIEYKSNNIEIVVKSDNRKKTKHSIKFSSNITNFYNGVLNLAIQTKRDLLTHKNILDEADALSNKEKIHTKVNSEIAESSYSNYFSDSIFIPASRSFFSTLNKNIWTLTDQDIIDVDPFVSRFGRAYEQAKLLYNIIEKYSDDTRNLGESNFQGYNKSLKCLNDIINGKYIKIRDKDWIQGDNYKVNLSRASSGQQESLPMLMVLIFGATRKDNDIKQFFIEEPEAHLFPDAQNDIISLLLNLKSKNNVSFFITTHSPYILSALNNSIYGNELVKKNKLSLDKFIQISKGSYPLDYDDVSAYSLENGKIKDIKDLDFHMIGGEILDNVSNEFGNVMDTLMELDD